MRKAVAIVFAVLSCTSAVFAKGKHDWEHVEKLKSGTPVVISLWSGRLISGSVDAVGPDAVRIDTADPDVGVGSLIEFGRTDIRRVVLVRRTDLPDPQRWMAMGALIGGGVGFTSGAIYDVAHHENYHWLTAGLGGAGVGYIVSCAALAGVSVVDVVKLFHDRTLVYEDQRIGKMQTN